ncbi:carboxyl transferase domain-containing protein (plasmid) [Lactiplantibacillus plantarum]|uniref:carboxyl transferase domain-containing protein n=1 Tax=Lactiplantibacillus plantarum TaxID=1590 RepID=UPI00338FAE8C
MDTKKVIDGLQKARDVKRISGKFVIDNLFTEKVFFHGDRISGDDPAIVAGAGIFNGEPWTFVILGKGNSRLERIQSHNGCAQPMGYRKVIRVAQMAEKFHMPVLFLVDTPGAYCGVKAEEQGQSYAIARDLYILTKLKTQIITVITGEGGSGGALALACGDAVFMLEDSIYSVISPEGCSSIIWKDNRHVTDAANLLQIFPKELEKKQIIDGIIPNKDNGTLTVAAIKRCLLAKFIELSTLKEQDLLLQRNKRFRKF